MGGGRLVVVVLPVRACGWLALPWGVVVLVVGRAGRVPGWGLVRAWRGWWGRVAGAAGCGAGAGVGGGRPGSVKGGFSLDGFRAVVMMGAGGG